MKFFKIGAMTTLTASLLILGFVVMDYKTNGKVRTKITWMNKSTSSFKEIPIINNNLKSEKPVLDNKPLEKTIVMEESNTIVIRGTIDSGSMAMAMQELLDKTKDMTKDDTIFLFMDTGGGSIFAGLDFIDFANSLPVKIVTITKFAASMGFQIVQNMGNRYITPTGILMSHRARGGVEGQFDGELESQYKMVKEQIDRLDVIASDRMKISYKEYKELIINEFWSNGFRSVNNKSADEVVHVSCGKSMFGTSVKRLDTFFGKYAVETSKCPLIRGFLNVKPSGSTYNSETHQMILDSYNSPEKFLKEYILTNKFYKHMR